MPTNSSTDRKKPSVNGKAPSVHLSPVGRSGLNRWGGRVYEEWLAELKHDKAVMVYREMRDNEPIINSLLFLVEMLIRGVAWSAEAPPDQDGKPREDDEATQFLEECMNDMVHSWDDLLDEALSMLVFGWSLHEVIYKIRRGQTGNPFTSSNYNDGRFGWAAVPLRGQETRDEWLWDDFDQVAGMWQTASRIGDRVFIPMDKAVLFRTTKRKNNPEGRSILRGAYRPWYFKKQLEILEGIGAERDLTGLPTLQVPPEILMEDADPKFQAMRGTLQEWLRKLYRGEQEGILVPNEESGYKFELVSTPGARSVDSGAIVERKTKEIALVILADFILLGHEQVGSYALGVSKVGLFATAMNGWLEAIESTINASMVKPLMELNGFSAEGGEMPHVRAGKVSVRDVKDKVTALKDMATAGIISNVPIDVVNTVLRELDLPEVDEKDLEPKDPLGGLPAGLSQALGVGGNGGQGKRPAPKRDGEG